MLSLRSIWCEAHMLSLHEGPCIDVILSGAIASRSEAIAKSKDPYLCHGLIGSREFRRPLHAPG